MDNFSYTYLNIGSAPSNRLGHVSDAVNASANTDDIESQDPNNYSYDELGQLASDQQEQIANIEWRSGDKKIKTLTRAANAGNKSDMEFVYNPMGQRILKIEKPRVNNVLQTRNWWKYTYYTYDANGQVMATYEVSLNSGFKYAYLKDQNIYGASRLGMRKNYMALYSNVPVPYVIPAVQQNTLGNIAYEITNYPPVVGRSLGNVNVVISDRKIWNATPNSAFKACVVSRTDYFPFGMEISSRTSNSDNYRFGYNGMESDNETKGSGNSYTTEFRQYDPRLGRWLSLDPLMAQFPWQSPYCAFDNNPVFFTDPLGLAAEGCEGDPPAGTNRTNPATGTVYTSDGNGGWIQNIEEVTVKPQSLNDYTSAAVENNENNGGIASGVSKALASNNKSNSIQTNNVMTDAFSQVVAKNKTVKNFDNKRELNKSVDKAENIYSFEKKSKEKNLDQMSFFNKKGIDGNHAPVEAFYINNELSLKLPFKSYSLSYTISNTQSGTVETSSKNSAKVDIEGLPPMGITFEPSFDFQVTEGVKKSRIYQQFEITYSYCYLSVGYYSNSKGDRGFKIGPSIGWEVLPFSISNSKVIE